MLRKQCNTETGDGLYKDIYEEGKCTYKGANPNNYIKFNNEIWRILSVEVDGRIKIIRNESIGNRAFDSENNNAWEESELKIYLNGKDFESIMTNQDKIESSTWSIGEIKENNNNLNEQISDENKIQSQNTSVGLITASEYIRANNDITNCGNMNLNNINRTICKEKNWIYTIVPQKGYLWTISNNINGGVFDIIADIYNPGLINLHDFPSTDHVGVAPSIYLSADVTLSGTGSEIDPYIITN